MSREKTELMTMHVDEVVMKRLEVYDLNLSSEFTIASATWQLISRGTLTSIISGSCTPNNSDTDRAGNTIRTVAMTIDTRNTDIERGFYWLIVRTVLNTGQTDTFRFSVEMLDLSQEV